MAKLLQTNLPFATGPNVTADTFNQLVRILEINLGSIDPDNTLQLTTAERDTLNFNLGQIIYNTTTTTLQYWDGAAFQNISAIGAVNLNVSDGTSTIGINLNTQTLSLIGGTGITSNASGTSVTFAIDSSVVTLTGTQTLTNKTLTSPTLTSPVLNGTLSGSAFLDEDNMASNSATAVASQQSIKAYVDSQVGTVDTLAEILANGNTTGGTDIAVSANDDITFTDSSKALFGAGNDLQIYHDGTHSYIEETNGTGNLYIRGESIDLRRQANGEQYILAQPNGAVTLFYDGSSKLATTNTGIDVTGGADAIAKVTGTTTAARLDLVTNSHHRFWQVIESDGRARFYDQTANAERLTIDSSGLVGIRTSSPSERLHINGGSSDVALRVDTTNADPKIRLTTLGQQDWTVGVDYSDGGKFKICESGTVGTLTALTIDASRRVGIGTESPDTTLDVTTGGVAGIILNQDTSNSAASSRLFFKDQTRTNAILNVNGNLELRTGATIGVTSGTKRLVVNGNGNVGIGDNAAPSRQLTVYKTSANAALAVVTSTALQAQIALGDTVDDNYAQIILNNATNKLQIQNGGGGGITDRGITLDSSENVGIATSSPATKLDVNGTSTFRDDVTFTGASANILYDSSTNNLEFQDTAKASFGTDNDLLIYHDSESVIEDVGTNGLIIRTDGPNISIDGGSEVMGKFIKDGAVELYYDNNKRFETTSVGVNIPNQLVVQGTSTFNDDAIFVNDALWGDNDKAIFGASSDLQIYHNGTHSYIDETGTGDLRIKTNFFRVRNTGDTSNMIIADQTGAVTLYHNGNTRAATTSIGLSVTGDIALTGSIQNTVVPAEASVKINENGYADGTTYFRDLDIFDGKGNQFVKFDGSTQRVGIKTTTPKATLQVDELGIETSSATTSSTTETVVDSCSATDFRTVKYLVQISNTTDSEYHATEILLTHDGTTPSITEYATIFTGAAAEATFDADISGGNIRLKATPASTDNMTFKIARSGITV